MSCKSGNRRQVLVNVASLYFHLPCGVVCLNCRIGANLPIHLMSGPRLLLIFIFLSLYSHSFCIRWKIAPLPNEYSLIYSKSGRLIPFIIIVSALTIFLLMSFRYDTLFAGTSEAHWEYYVGPIRNIKNGSWLLWDTPSQYGFLNILTTALLPITSAWQSLYVLQGVLLFITAILIFMVFLSKDRMNVLFAFIITISSLFFADPDLIGPYLYPSSSVMRFFWCYALLGFFYLTNHNQRIALKTVVIWGTLLWLMGVLWSSESAIYSTVTFYCGLIASVYRIHYWSQAMRGN